MWLIRETIRSAGDRSTTTKANSHFFVEMSQNPFNTVTLQIGSQDPKEFLSELHQAITQVKLLIFERRQLDLGEDETFALYVLTKLQGQIVK
jgi:hypothetical protein